MRNIQSKLYLEWKNNNRYNGKYFSVLGDSISTLEGFNPSGYKVFYEDENCFRTGVNDMKDTWWGKVIEFFGGQLLVNNSWSGSRVTKLPNCRELFPSGCSDERTNGLHIDSVKPDIIIVYLGINDWAFGAKVDFERVGFFDKLIKVRTDEYSKGDETVFSVAYNKMLSKLKRNYPDTEIWCCTLNTTFMSSKPEFSFPYTYAGTHIEVYNNIIKTAVQTYDCNLIDLYGYHVPYDAVDGTHPTVAGMDTLATMIIRQLVGEEAGCFMD